MSDNQNSDQLPEWSDAQQEEDFTALRSLEGKAVTVKLQQADIIARIVPMGVQGQDSEVGKRVARIADETAWSVGTVQTMRRVGCRWIPLFRKAVAKTKATVAWETIVVAASFGKGKGNELDPCMVLVELCQERPGERISTQTYRDHFEEAVSAGTPKPDVPEKTLTLADVLGDLPGDDTDEPVGITATGFEHLVESINQSGGKKSDRDVATLAAGDLAPLLATLPTIDAFLARFDLVKGTPAGERLRGTLITFLRHIVTRAEIAPDLLLPLPDGNDG